VADRIGIEVAPDVLEMLFRVGATVSGRHGFKAHLAENGIPEDFKMAKCGYDREKGLFYFIFAPKEGPATGPIVYQAPVYEREAGDAINS
jgi:hypothetical protein